jgi:osmoprotectant transport system permease protein
LLKHPELKVGVSEEFLERKDGWPFVQQCYGLPQTRVRGMDHNMAYRGIKTGSHQLVDLYSTDAKVSSYNLRTLIDDRNCFPTYHAVILYRLDLAKRAPGVLESMRRLEGQINEAAMIALNAQAEVAGISEGRVAVAFLKEKLGLDLPLPPASDWSRAATAFAQNTRDHLFLVCVSLTAAVLIAVPLGVLSARRPALGKYILGGVGVIQTLPSLALLSFMVPLLGLGAWPAIVALFLYSLLPIVRNTATGLQEIPAGIHESAQVLGLPSWARLWQIELPMASRSILGGIKTAAVINVGTATLGALIGAGGYGQPIQTGIRLDSVSLILQGAVPAALLALLVQALFGLAEKVVVPRGLLLKSGG